MKYCAYLFIVLFTLCSCGDEYLRKRVNTLEREVVTLRNEIAIYKGMERDVGSRDLSIGGIPDGFYCQLLGCSFR